jgi:tRNA-specific adenosine deaminase 1
MYVLSPFYCDCRIMSYVLALCWIANSSSRYEILIHGLRRGVGDKQRLKPHLRLVTVARLEQALTFHVTNRPLVSKLALFALYKSTLIHLNLPPMQYVYRHPFNAVFEHGISRSDATYHSVKHAATAYQIAKSILTSPHGPFAGWIVSGKQWEAFTADGVVTSKTGR